MSPKINPLGNNKQIGNLKKKLAACKTQLKLKTESEKDYRVLVEHSISGFYVIQNGVFQFVNRRLLKETGYKKEELIGKPFWKFVHKDDRPIAKNRGLTREQRQIRPSHYRIRIIRKDGTIIWVDMGGTHANYHGHTANIGSAINITYLKEAEDEIRRSEERYRTILEQIEDGYFEIDLGGNIKYFNRAILRTFGYTAEEFMGMNYRLFTEKEDQQKIFEAYNYIFGTGKPHNAYTMKIIGKDGTRRFVEFSVSLMLDDDKNAEGFRGIGRDITERKQMEEELRLHQSNLEKMVKTRTSELHKINKLLKKEIVKQKVTENQLRREKNFKQSVINSLPGIFYVYDRNNILKQWNRNAEILVGYTPEELNGAHASKFFSKGIWPLVEQRMDEVFKKGRTTVEAMFTAKDGRQIPLYFSAVRATLDGKPYLVGITLDLSQRIIAEEALHESQMELKILSTQLLEAHESERKRISQELHDGIGQSLTAIKFGLEQILGHMFENQTPTDQEFVENLISKSQESIDEIRRISMDLRPSILDDLGILATIRWFCREFEKTYSGVRVTQGINISENQIPGELKTTIYRILQEAFNNIAKHSHADKVLLNLRIVGERLELLIEDNGRGFDLDNIYSSDKAGRGFGLASMRERTELSGGSFGIDSRPGYGARIFSSWSVLASL